MGSTCCHSIGLLPPIVMGEECGWIGGAEVHAYNSVTCALYLKKTKIRFEHRLGVCL
jgi:hypothetical protein